MTDDRTDQIERWRLEARLDQLSAELTELRILVGIIDDIIRLRMAGRTGDAAALLDDLQRNRVAMLRDQYPHTGR